MIGLSDRERRSKESGDVPETPMQRDGAFHHGKEVIQPSSFHFVTVMDAYAKAGKGVEGARQCEKLLRRLESLHEKHGYPELQPNPIVRDHPSLFRPILYVGSFTIVSFRPIVRHQSAMAL